MKKVKIDKIKKDEEIYPRKQVSRQTIKYYAESLKAGAEFPQITIQKIKENGEEKTIVLDGWHRLKAYEEVGREKIEAEFWKKEVLDKEKWLYELIIQAIKLNRKHGRNLLEKDLKSKARVIAKHASIDEVVGLNKRIANDIELEENTVSEYISDITTRKRGSRNGKILKLSRLGWIQEEIANKVGLSQNRVSEIIEKFDIEEIDNFYQREQDVKNTAEHFGLDLITTYSIILEGKSDLERFEIFGKSEYGNDQPKLSDYWKFNKPDPRIPSEYEGPLWGQDIMNILYRYSEQGDLVVDPMAGGGSVIDTCLVMGRKCRAYDKKPVRKEIRENNIKEGYPGECMNCDLIIFDPPYFKKKEEEYNSQKITKNRKTFLNFIEKFAKDSFEILKEDGYVAMIYGHYWNYENESKSIFGSDLVKKFEDNDFRLVGKFQSSLTFDNQWNPSQVKKAKKQDPWKILPVSRDWYIFKK